MTLTPAQIAAIALAAALCGAAVAVAGLLVWETFTTQGCQGP